MALTFLKSREVPKKKGGPELRFIDITFDDSYPTGGEAITAANIGFTTIYAVFPPASLGGCVLEWDKTNSKIKAWYADYDATGDGILIELANTSDVLDGLIARCLVYGY